jgi:hypothetical protein
VIVDGLPDADGGVGLRHGAHGAGEQDTCKRGLPDGVERDGARTLGHADHCLPPE